MLESISYQIIENKFYVSNLIFTVLNSQCILNIVICIQLSIKHGREARQFIDMSAPTRLHALSI